MLIRISLIVAIIAGLAVGGLNFVKVKEKITILQHDLKTEADAHKEFQGKFNVAQKDLNKTTAELKQTKAELEASNAAKEKAEADVATLTKRADKLTEDLNKTRQEREDAQQQLAAFKALGLTPQQIAGMDKAYKAVQDNLAVSETENKVLMQEIRKVKTQLAVFVDPTRSE